MFGLSKKAQGRLNERLLCIQKNKIEKEERYADLLLRAEKGLMLLHEVAQESLIIKMLNTGEKLGIGYINNGNGGFLYFWNPSKSSQVFRETGPVVFVLSNRLTMTISKENIEELREKPAIDDQIFKGVLDKLAELSPEKIIEILENGAY